jgi:predicted DCC family thiol-disulfide oxidoreductase YuxK
MPLSNKLSISWTNGKSSDWTGGQYSLFRALFGVYLFFHFVALIPWGGELFSNRGALANGAASPLLYLFPNILALSDPPWSVAALLVTASSAAIFFALGVWDRAAAIVQWYVLACLFGRNPLTANPSLPFVGWMLLAHVCLPKAPFGSLAARNRLDPRGSWRMPPAIFHAAWIVMSLSYSYSGYTKLFSPSWVDGSALCRILDNPLARPTLLREIFLSLPPIFLQLATWGGLGLESLYAPLALFRRLRPWLWLLMVTMHLGLITLVDFADLTLGMLLLHGFTFDPAWIAPKSVGQRATVFYDGHCGLCHSFVRFILAEDRRGGNIFFSPLQGEHFGSSVPLSQRAGLPDSVVVQTGAGRLLVRSAAVVEILQRLGGVWRLIGVMAACLPRKLLDGCYDLVARLRLKLFTPPVAACPLLPADLQERFQL